MSAGGPLHLMAPDGKAEARIRFRCNICGVQNEMQPREFAREVPSCTGCRSTVRTRALMRMLARELLGADLRLPEFPVLKGIRGLGISDSVDYTGRLNAKFDYRNTEYERAPHFDVLHPDEREFGLYDFIVCSEILEHVVAPVDIAFRNLFRLLKPNGVLLMTVPYRPEGAIQEHFGPMDDFGIARVGDRTVVVRRESDGSYSVRDNLVFHGGRGSTLEMRLFSEDGLRQLIATAGFSSVKIYTEDCRDFGILNQKTWSLPLAAHTAPFALSLDNLGMWSEQWMELRNRLRRIL